MCQAEIRLEAAGTAREAIDGCTWLFGLTHAESWKDQGSYPYLGLRCDWTFDFPIHFPNPEFNPLI